MEFEIEIREQEGREPTLHGTFACKRAGLQLAKERC